MQTDTENESYLGLSLILVYKTIPPMGVKYSLTALEFFLSLCE